MKKIINKLIKEGKSLINNPNFVIGFISVVVFIIGGLALNWIISFIAVAIIDAILFIPKIIRKKNHGKKMPATKKKKIIKIVLLGFLSLAIIGIILMTVFFYMIIKKAPDFDPEALYQKDASVLYASNGEIYAKLGSQKRVNITYNDTAEVLVNAIVATEDSRFFQHNGFDLLRFLKASFYQVLGHSDAGGASTLTMQLSKKFYTSTERSGIEGIIRKFTDIYMAVFKIEKKYTKEQILEFYMNSNYLGALKYGGAYGVEQACLTYFGKSAKDINLAEAAMIAGLFNAPGSLDPYVNPKGAEERRKTVLYLMERHGYITEEERKAADELTVDKLIIEHESSDSKYQGYIDTVVEEVKDLTGKNPYEVPMIIYTNLDMDKQDHINKIVNGETFTWENDQVNAGVSVVDINTGALVAVGAGRNKTGILSLNYTTFKYANRRQIGSTAKPMYDYGPGIEYNNWSTYTPFVDEEYAYSNGVEIGNWDGKYQGFLTLRQALVGSRNVTALKAFQSVKNSNIKTFVTGLGLSPEIDSGMVHEAHAIGGYNGESPLTVSAAYAAFANGGYYITPHSVNKVIIRDTNETIENKVQKTRAMSDSTAYMITNVLVDTAKSALGSYTNVNGKIYAAKTGTSNFTQDTIKTYGLPSSAINDLWVAGYNTQYSIALWYGYSTIDKNYVTKFGNFNHAKLFQAIAKGVFTSNDNFTQPSDVVEVKIEKETNPAMLPSEYTPANMITTELFKKGSEPTEVSKRYSQLGDVTNLDGTAEGNKINLTWDAISTPSAIDQGSLSAFYKSLYSKASDQNYYLNIRLSYNNNNIGTLGYNVYSSKNGKLTLLGFTKETKYTITNNSTDTSLTYVVKSVYTIFKANESKGSEITVKLDSSNSIVTSELNGDSSINLNIGDTFSDINPAILVYENTVLIQNSSDIKVVTSVKRGSDSKDNLTLSDIKTDKNDTYTITYKVAYKTYTQTYTRKVIIGQG